MQLLATSVPPFIMTRGTFLAQAAVTAIHPSNVSVSRFINAHLERMDAQLSPLQYSLFWVMEPGRRNSPCEGLVPIFTSICWLLVCQLSKALPGSGN